MLRRHASQRASPHPPREQRAGIIMLTHNNITHGFYRCQPLHALCEPLAESHAPTHRCRSAPSLRALQRPVAIATRLPVSIRNLQPVGILLHPGYNGSRPSLPRPETYGVHLRELITSIVASPCLSYLQHRRRGTHTPSILLEPTFQTPTGVRETFTHTSQCPLPLQHHSGESTARCLSLFLADLPEAHMRLPLFRSPASELCPCPKPNHGVFFSKPCLPRQTAHGTPTLAADACRDGGLH